MEDQPAKSSAAPAETPDSARTTASQHQRGEEWTGLNRKQSVSERFVALKSGIAQVQNAWPDAAAVLAQHIFMTPTRRRAALQHWLQSSPPKLDTVAAGKMLVKTYQWGQAPWVLLVHGWDANAASMSRLVDPIMSKGFGVLAFDAPAHGDSDGEVTTVKGFADACQSMLTSYANVTAIIGHSIGGSAIAMALEALPTIRPRVALVSAPCDADVVVALFSRLFELNEQADANLRRRLSNAAGRPIENISFRKMANSFKSQVLIVHDHSDQVVPLAQGKESARTLPNAEFIETHNLGHHKTLEDAAVVASLAAFATSIDFKL